MRHHFDASRLSGRLLGIALSLPLAFTLLVSPVAFAMPGNSGLSNGSCTWACKEPFMKQQHPVMTGNGVHHQKRQVVGLKRQVVALKRQVVGLKRRVAVLERRVTVARQITTFALTDNPFWRRVKASATWRRIKRRA